MPLVSVVVPMRNAEAYVEEALASVLQESTVPLEVVVIDDGSTDRSRARVEGIGDPRIVLVTGPGKGFPASINTGLSIVRGDIVMQCDADDLYPAGRIKRQVQWLQDHPEYEAVCGGFSTVDVKGRLVAHLGLSGDGSPQDIDGELRQGITRTSLCTFAVRRRMFDKVGMHRPFFETSSDIDFQLRLGEVARVCYLPETTYFYRLHGSSITHTQGNARRVFFEDAARSFQQQRRDHGQDDVQKGTPPVPPAQHQDSPNEVASQIQGMLLGQAWRKLAEGARGQALQSLCRAIAADPRSLGVWRSGAALVWRALRPGTKSKGASL